MRQPPVAEAVAVREALEVLIDSDAAQHRNTVDIADIKRGLAKLKSAAAKGTTAFLLANWDLHERIAQISPNQTASALYLSMTRFVREHAIAATHDESPETATEWLGIRIAAHSELVEAIIAGDVARTKKAVEGHAGLLDTNQPARRRYASCSARTHCSTVVGVRPVARSARSGCPRSRDCCSGR